MNINALLFRLPLSAVALCAASFALVGCQKVEDSKTPAVANAAPAPTTGDKGTTATPASTNLTPAQEKAHADAAMTQMQTLQNTIMQETHSRPFPPGTQLKRITIDDDKATLNFSPEFNKIKTMGESSESELQKLLRKRIAAVPAVRTLSVLVDGKPFESEATDWSAIPVRDTEAARDSGSPGGQQ